MAAVDPLAILAIFTALAMGGIVKGATGAGAPVAAIPVIAALFDVRLAVMVMAAPNLLSNCWQLWQFRAHRLPGSFPWIFAGGAALGCIGGTLLLASLPERWLVLTVALCVAAYIGLRLLRPEFRLAFETARRIVWPVSLVSGLLQGAAGISAPVSVSYLNAMRLARPAFIATISACFIAMAAVQLPMLFATGLLSWPLLGVSIFALLPILGFMPLGAWLARALTPQGFDRLVLLMLGAVALRLFYVAFTG